MTEDKENWVLPSDHPIKLEMELTHQLPIIRMDGKKVSVVSLARIFFTDTDVLGTDYVEFAGHIEGDGNPPETYPPLRMFRYDFKTQTLLENVGGLNNA